ncbi:antibiotic biosynthesis monooxygenase [Streptomyces sp. SID6673]|nr:antibiotic biosynthesis monooxygenase [Streptomyces sp. SID11726]NEB23291.1 antibiotic biosynthesis monooxygenase [Streptomyces sp. SID6673]
MIFIVAKWSVKPEYVEQWPDLVQAFTQATRAEAGNKWFEWSRSLDDPSTYVLVEAFDDDAAQAHVTSEHFRTATAELPKYLTRTPDIVNATIDQETWSELGEMSVDS